MSVVSSLVFGIREALEDQSCLVAVMYVRSAQHYYVHRAYGSH